MACCGVCLINYDDTQSPPLLAPCGHTFCRNCVRQVRACPFCRAVLPDDRASLPRNYALLEVMGADKVEGEEELLLRQHGVLAALGLEGGDGGRRLLAMVMPAEELRLTSVQLGSQVSSRVVLAYHQEREVAVKLLPLSGAPAAREALLREVRLLARVSSSCHHTVRLLGVTVKDGALALVMRRYPASLAQHIDRQQSGRLSPARVLLLAQDLLRGLSELHGLGVVMADLKPDNVMLDEGGAPLLADFGIARAVTTTVGQQASTSPQGTLNYMAPEQFAVDEDYVLTPQSDIWALGATLLHALTGSPPWAGLNMGQIAAQVGVRHRSPDLPPNLPGPLRELLQGCLRPGPRERPAAASALAELSRELERSLEGLLAPGVAVAAGAGQAASDGSTAPSVKEDYRPLEVAYQLPSQTTQAQGRTGQEPGSSRATPPAPASAPARRHSEHMPVYIHLVDPVTFGIVEPPAVVLYLPILGREGDGYGRLAVLGQLPVPEVFQRVLVRASPCSGSSFKDLVVFKEGQAVAHLKCFKTSDGEPEPRQLVIADKRVRRPRVEVVLHGSFGTVRVQDVKVDYTFGSADLAAAALEKLPQRWQHVRSCGPFAMLVDGQRRCVPRLLGSGLITDGGECHMDGKEPANTRVTVSTRASRIHFPVALSWLVISLKELVQSVEGVPPDQQKLLFGGVELEDDKELSEYGIIAGAEIDMFHPEGTMTSLTLAKPVICIWPSADQPPTEVAVRLQLSQQWALSSLVPRPDWCDGGGWGPGGGPVGRCAEWRVVAHPDGTLSHHGSGGRQYSYLFWEAEAVGAGEAGSGGQMPQVRVGQLEGPDSEASSDVGSGGSTSGHSDTDRSAGSSTSIGSLDREDVDKPVIPSPKAPSPAVTHGSTRSPISGLGPTPCDLPLPDFDAAHSFCVAGADVETWLYGALEAFGLPVRERTDFLTYWLPHMEGAAWLLLSFADPAAYQAAAALHVSPAPDVLVRVCMLFERLASPVEVRGCLAAEVQRVGVLRRQGARLAVLEWGVMEVVRRRE